MLVGKELQTIVLPHRIHVWYIHLHVVDFDGKLVAKTPKMDPMSTKWRFSVDLS